MFALQVWTVCLAVCMRTTAWCMLCHSPRRQDRHSCPAASTETSELLSVSSSCATPVPGPVIRAACKDRLAVRQPSDTRPVMLLPFSRPRAPDPLSRCPDMHCSTFCHAHACLMQPNFVICVVHEYDISLKLPTPISGMPGWSESSEHARKAELLGLLSLQAVPSHLGDAQRSLRPQLKFGAATGQHWALRIAQSPRLSALQCVAVWPLLHQQPHQSAAISCQVILV